MQAYRSSIIHFMANPQTQGEAALSYFEDGLLVVNEGLVVQCGHYATLIQQLDKTLEVNDYSGHLIMPGFIDTHTHYVQTGVMASYGAQLIDWLNDYTFPAECQFEDQAFANAEAEFFIQQTLSHGTTTAMIFPSVHTQSVDAIFNAALKRNMRVISGKVMMDRNAPKALLDTAQTSYDDSKQLIQKWHNKARLLYAVTPRFAPTSTPEQLEIAGQLLLEHKDLYCQTHVAENKAEVEWVKQLYPKQKSYLDVYAHYGLLNKRSMMAHCLYLNEGDLKAMSQAQTAASFCPTSNLFLGSGLFSMADFNQHSINLSIGSDIGGGTSMSMLKTLGEAYKVSQLNGFSLTSLYGFYLLTLGAAKALDCDEKIGNFVVGKEADFIVIDKNSTPIIKHRMATTNSIEQQLFVQMMLADDRAILATYILGECQYLKENGFE